jgi:biotin transport system substrate-specific component
MFFASAKLIFSLSLLVLASFVILPIGPFSYCPQLLIVFFLSQIFRKNYALLAVFIYLLLGIFGLPIFRYGGGWTYLSEPSFGFLLAMIPLALLGFYFKNHLEASSSTRILLLLSSVFLSHFIAYVFFLFRMSFDFIPFFWSGLLQFVLDVFFVFLISFFSVIVIQESFWE